MSPFDRVDGGLDTAARQGERVVRQSGTAGGVTVACGRFYCRRRRTLRSSSGQLPRRGVERHVEGLRHVQQVDRADDVEHRLVGGDGCASWHGSSSE